MTTIHVEGTVEKEGKLHLDHLPFPEGAIVSVQVSPLVPSQAISLRGSVLSFDDPFAPVSADDWESSK